MLLLLDGRELRGEVVARGEEVTDRPRPSSRVLAGGDCRAEPRGLLLDEEPEDLMSSANEHNANNFKHRNSAVTFAHLHTGSTLQAFIQRLVNVNSIQY